VSASDLAVERSQLFFSEVDAAAAKDLRELRRKLRRSSTAVATSREGQGFSHEDCPQLFVALRMLRLRTIYCAENIGNVLKRVVNVRQRQRVNEVLGPRVTEFICNVGRENVRPIQHVFYGGLLDPMSAINLVRHSAPPKLFETPYTHIYLTVASSYQPAFIASPHI